MADQQEYEYIFVKNEQVEVLGHKLGRLESFYTATIMAEQQNNHYQIEYNTQKSLFNPGRLRRTVHKAFIRPKPNQTFIHIHNPGSKVDAYIDGGWWTGRVNTYTYDTNSYEIHFNHYNCNTEIHATNVRIYKKWYAYDNTWVHSQLKTYRIPFFPNTEVEVIGHEEGMLGSFHRATVIDQLPNNQYEVEYKTLYATEGDGKHRETIHSNHIRPKPNPTYVYIYPLGAKVNAFDNGGWWTGTINTYDRHTRRYHVELDHYHIVNPYHISDIRIHQTWNPFNNTWEQTLGRIQGNHP